MPQLSARAQLNANKTRLSSRKNPLERNRTMLGSCLLLAIYWLLCQTEEQRAPLWFAFLWDHLIHNGTTRELIAPWFWLLAEWLRDRLTPALTQTPALRSGVEQLTLVIEITVPGHAEDERLEPPGDRKTLATNRQTVTLSLNLSLWS